MATTTANAIAPSLTASEMTKAMPATVLDKMIASIPLGRMALYEDLVGPLLNASTDVGADRRTDRAPHHRPPRQKSAGDRTDTAAERAASLGIAHLHVSMSHDAGIATATVLTRVKRGLPFYRTVFFLPTMVPLVAACPELLDKRALDRFYSPGRLDSDDARAGWLAPDLAPGIDIRLLRSKPAADRLRPAESV